MNPSSSMVPGNCAAVNAHSSPALGATKTRPRSNWTTKSYYDDLAPLKERVRRETMTGFELTNDLDISIVTNNDKSVRGRPILTAVLDECSRYKDQDSATPDVELYRALKPGMKTIAESLLLGISTPYRKSGILFDKFKQSYGRDDAFSSGTAFVECTCARA
jgi:phage terminase large subunit-like protein